jgi:ankyrin repeat protein
MDPNSHNLFQAAMYGETEVVRQHLDIEGTNIDVEDYRGLTSLQIACIYGHLDVVRLLLDRGANIEAAGRSGQTSLILASMNGRHNIVKELLGRGANIEAAENRYGWNSLMLASSRGYPIVVKELVDRGANIFAKNVAGVTARQAAETNGFAEVAEFLRKKEQAIGRKGLAEAVVKNRRTGPDVPTDVQKKIVGYLGGRKKRTKRNLVRRKKQKGTRRR